ncbi:unnamed protein product [Microthlaspi erraticum]|uniref:Uncharacterized protein n=1 Tax=Microthlaspi erraticum TaxID=1685480 RepID=A0A6D2K2Z6_9BRAS|nr:unnamed protein product [Microthlaspi erraticum]
MGEASKATQVSAHIMASTMSLCSLLFIEMLARYREMLDTASNGNFLNQDVDDGWQLVENIATPMEAMEKSMIAPTGARPTTRSSPMRN